MNTNNPLIPTGLPDWLSDHAEEVAGWGPAPVARGCWVIGCRRDAHLHGLCKTHHTRAQRTWRPRRSQTWAARSKTARDKQPVVGPASDSETDPEEG